jgi:hypothetical protein
MSQEPSAVEAEREPNFPLARWERPTLSWIARRLPRWVLPDDLTIVGVAAALGICGAYQLSNDESGWLWLASGLLVIQWLGDSLDFHLVDLDLTVFDVIGLGIAAVMIVLLVGRAASNLRKLARQEPAAPRS